MGRDQGSEKEREKEEANYCAEPFKKFALSSKTADGGDMEKSKVGDDSESNFMELSSDPGGRPQNLTGSFSRVRVRGANCDSDSQQNVGQTLPETDTTGCLARGAADWYELSTREKARDAGGLD